MKGLWIFPLKHINNKIVQWMTFACIKLQTFIDKMIMDDMVHVLFGFSPYFKKKSYNCLMVEHCVTSTRASSLLRTLITSILALCNIPCSTKQNRVNIRQLFHKLFYIHLWKNTEVWTSGTLVVGTGLLNTEHFTLICSWY